MTRRRAIVAVLALALLVVALKIGRVLTHAPPPSTSAGATPRGPADTHSAKPTPPVAGASLPERGSLADTLNSPTTDIRGDLRVVSDILETFRSNFPQNGNPTGTNAEITAVLTGKNRLRLALIPSDHPAINPDGELCDRWGTPFFFHAESATRMEIRSAGPDHKMWTDDDVTFVP